ncbi:hypothetical protein [Sediminicoccus sp. KRV36]|uniref:hypothetical protein n=1 Tax=Sediminicoccus sp. KRV36 TaxID=3133721 RepID=UPI00200D998E|nr:hypothetical protein [Sediminicoccus rosea]UPY35498.1 hypothetical protein LHU95_14865 [Sediminicoccus rosea]
MRVLKDITTPTSHFPAGAEIEPEQLDGPMTVADWQRIGHLEAPPAPAEAVAELPTRATKPLRTPDAPRDGD